MTISLHLPQFSLVFAISALALATPAAAQEVTLRGIDSPLDVTGTLLSAEAGRFVLRTEIGEFEIEQSLVTCEGDACPQARDIDHDFNLAGEGHVSQVLIPILAEGFAATLDAETVLLDANGTPLDAVTELGEGGQINIRIVDFDGEALATLGVLEAEGEEAYALLVSGEAPIVFSDVRASRKERDFVKAGGAGDLSSSEQSHVIAVEGFAVVVNPKNALGGVTVQQVADVFAGNITDWEQLGGTPGPINLYSYDSNSETFDVISELVLEQYDYTLSPEANIVQDTGELTAAITGDEAGFGMVSYSARRGTRAVPLTDECELTYYISPFTIKTEEYPLSRRVHIYNRPDLEGYARDFLDYTQGPDLDGLVSKAGFIDLSVTAEIQLDAAERVAAAASQATDAYERGFMETLMQKQNEYERLSTTFRFAPGSNELDAKSQRDLARTLAFLQSRKSAEVIAVGFTDDKGPFDANLLVSEQRASEVLDQIRAQAGAGALDGIDFRAMGFGELSPAACNSTPIGRRTNRRVELWIK